MRSLARRCIAELLGTFMLVAIGPGAAMVAARTHTFGLHDGSIKTLGEVLDHYAAEGRTIASGPYAGVGHDNRNKAPNVHGFSMTASEKRDLIAFLESLTDTAFLRNPALSNPWK